MKKILFSLAMTALVLTSCGGGEAATKGPDAKESAVAKDFDYKLLTDEAKTKELAAELIAKAGDNISKIDEIEAYISRPSVEGTIKRPDRKDYITLKVTYLDPNDSKKLYENRYYDGKWSAESKGVRLITGNAETFVLADRMYDASAVTSEMVASAVKEAWDKYKDETKYSDQWVRSVEIKNGQISVSVKGILASNDLEKTEYFKKKIK